MTSNLHADTCKTIKLHVHRPIFSADFVLVDFDIADCKNLDDLNSQTHRFLQIVN